MTDPRPAPYSSSAPVATPTPIATLALVVAIVVVVFGLVQQFGVLLISIVGIGFSAYGVFTSVMTGLNVATATIALVLGLVALGRPDGRRVRTGIALGVAGSALVAVLFSFVVTAVNAAVR